MVVGSRNWVDALAVAVLGRVGEENKPYCDATRVAMIDGNVIVDEQWAKEEDLTMLCSSRRGLTLHQRERLFCRWCLIVARSEVWSGACWKISIWRSGVLLGTPLLAGRPRKTLDPCQALARPDRPAFPYL